MDIDKGNFKFYENFKSLNDKPNKFVNSNWYFDNDSDSLSVIDYSDNSSNKSDKSDKSAKSVKSDKSDKNDNQVEINNPFLSPFENNINENNINENISNNNFKNDNFSFKFSKKNELIKGNNTIQNNNNKILLGPKSTNRYNISNSKYFNYNTLKLIPLKPYLLKDDIHNLKYYFNYLNLIESFKNEDFHKNKQNIIFNDYNSLILFLFSNKKESHLFTSIINEKLFFSSVSFTNYEDLILFSTFNDNKQRLYNIETKNILGEYLIKDKEVVNQINHNNQNEFYITTINNEFYNFDIRVLDYTVNFRLDNNDSIINNINIIDNNLILNFNNKLQIYDLRNNKPLYEFNNDKLNQISKIKFLNNKIYQLNKFDNIINILNLSNLNEINLFKSDNNIIDIEINQKDNELYLLTEKNKNRYLEFFDLIDNSKESYEKLSVDNLIRINKFGINNDLLCQTNANFEIYFTESNI